MAYVATRGGERAIEQAERLFRAELGPIDAARVAGIEAALPWLVDRLMGEGSLHSRELASLALAQAGGELYEALLLLRAWRTTQPRLAVAEPVKLADTFTHRRISAAFKDLPGGQVLGPTLDYAHRLLATRVLEGTPFTSPAVEPAETPAPSRLAALTDWQKAQGLIDTPAPDPVAPDDIPDLTREPLMFPAARAHRLQSLARADTGGTLALGYSAQRGYGAAHPTVNELRLAEAEVRVRHPRGTVFSAGRVRLSSCEMIAKTVNADTNTEHLSLGFAATLGWNEVKVVAASTLDLNARPGGDRPASNEEFFLCHTEPVEASGFCIHLKLPHYVTFQSALDALRGITRDSGQARSADAVMEAAEARTAAAEGGARPPAREPAE